MTQAQLERVLSARMRILSCRCRAGARRSVVRDWARELSWMRSCDGLGARRCLPARLLKTLRTQGLVRKARGRRGFAWAAAANGTRTEPHQPAGAAAEATPRAARHPEKRQAAQASRKGTSVSAKAKGTKRRNQANSHRYGVHAMAVGATPVIEPLFMVQVVGALSPPWSTYKYVPPAPKTSTVPWSSKTFPSPKLDRVLPR